MHIMSSINQMSYHLHIHSFIIHSKIQSSHNKTKQNKILFLWIGLVKKLKPKTQTQKTIFIINRVSHLTKNKEKPKIENYLGDSSCMSKTMTSNVISKNEVFSGSWDTIILLLDPHFEMFGSNSIHCL